MKKNLLAMSAIALLITTGCKAETKTEIPVEKEPEVQEESGTAAPGMGDVRPEDITMDFGKIKKIVGNEIIIELASVPGMIGGDESDTVEGEGESSSIPATGMTPAMPAGEAEEVVVVDNGGSQTPKMELE
ncbi:MAG: hypothetical protein ACRCS6_07945, partial [Turicibacter sp.]